jgi:hypothetical protein
MDFFILIIFFPNEFSRPTERKKKAKTNQTKTLFPQWHKLAEIVILTSISLLPPPGKMTAWLRVILLALWKRKRQFGIFQYF